MRLLLPAECSALGFSGCMPHDYSRCRGRSFTLGLLPRGVHRERHTRQQGQYESLIMSVGPSFQVDALATYACMQAMWLSQP